MQTTNQTNHDISQTWIRIFRRNLPNFIFWTVTLRSVGNRRVHGDFEKKKFALQTQIIIHANTSRDKQKLNGHKEPEP